tara:strand:+ start:207 stop:866 length:660 start_codon:yes stop_codon:yes gene_type:complete
MQPLKTQGRRLSSLDNLFCSAEIALVTLFGSPKGTGRKDPAEHLNEIDLSHKEKQQASRLMRVNHVGEVCAQALYEGQAITARTSKVRDSLGEAAAEEQDHLIWCERRIKELGGRKSLLNPIWYVGAFGMGALAGLAGDKWSLGFLKETEKQVESHLKSHLKRLPVADERNRATLLQMQHDEAEHAREADSAGGQDLPTPIAKLMRVTSRVMTGVAHWI